MSLNKVCRGLYLFCSHPHVWKRTRQKLWIIWKVSHYRLLMEKYVEPHEPLARSPLNLGKIQAYYSVFCMKHCLKIPMMPAITKRVIYHYQASKPFATRHTCITTWYRETSIGHWILSQNIHRILRWIKKQGHPQIKFMSNSTTHILHKV